MYGASAASRALLDEGCADRLPITQAGEADTYSRGLSLLTRFNLRGDQADAIDTRSTHDVNRASDLAEVNSVIAFDESNFFRAQLENIVQASSEIVPSNLVLINQHFPACGYLDHDRLGQQLLVFRLVGRRRLRHERVEPLRRRRSDHHKNDDEDEQHINKRNDVRFRHRSFVSSNCHSHGKTPSPLYEYFSRR